MTITVTDPATVLARLQDAALDVHAAGRCRLSPGLMGRAACPQFSSLATTCNTLALAFEVRGGSHDDHCHRAGHGVDRSATR